MKMWVKLIFVRLKNQNILHLFNKLTNILQFWFRLLNVTITDNKYVKLVFEHLDCDLYQYIEEASDSPIDSLTIKVVGIFFYILFNKYFLVFILRFGLINEFFLCVLEEFYVSDTLCSGILSFSRSFP